jgi:large subunit ribosomal protein L18
MLYAMVSEKKEREIRRERRILRVRKKVFGTPERPRLCVFRSNKHFYAQIIDDTKGYTICSASTLELKDKIKKTWSQEAAKEVGKLIAQKALEKGIKKVVFDRRFYKYHGKVKACAEGAREGGLEF